MSETLHDDSRQSWTDDLRQAISFTIEGTPASKGSYRAVTGRSRKTGKPVTRLIPMDSKERPWRDKVRQAALAAMTDNQFGGYGKDTPLILLAQFALVSPKTVRRHRPTVKPDLDKLLRCLMDGLTDSGIIHDDAQITSITTAKKYTGESDDTPGCTVLLTPQY